ncbi:MAG: Tol-Pal system protein TolB [Chlamydiota bacterium]
MNARKIIALITSLFVIHACYSDNSWNDDQIEVSLDTNIRLDPLYLSAAYQDNSSFSTSYLQDLKEVVTFDFNHNGRTMVVPQTESKEQLALQENLDTPWNIEKWNQSNVKYVVKLFFNDRMLSAKFLDLKGSTSKVITNIALSGEMSSDRHKVHQLADLAHKIFFNTEGVASTRILYSLRTRSIPGTPSSRWVSEIWESDYDGYNAHQITNLNEYAITPVYVPPNPGYSSGSFFYVSYRIGQPKIFVATLQDGRGQRFSYLRGNQLMPAISPQRDKVAFISDVTGNADLFLQSFNPEVGPQGKPRQIFSTRRGTQASPTFSPDGKRLAFVSNKDGSPRIYVMDVPSMEAPRKITDIKATLITKQNRENTSPSWSRDGKKIAYSSMTNGVRQLWYYDLETNEEKQITTGSGHKENPCWAADSLHIVFNSSTPFASDLYIVNLNQPHPLKISSGDGEKRFPFWEPITKKYS